VGEPVPVETVFMVGHAQLPQGMAAKSLFDTLAVTAEFETTHGVILRATVTLATEDSKAFFGRVLVGRSFNDSVEGVLQELRFTYQGAAQNALVAACKDLWRRYSGWKASRSEV
jgi:hypothetical protein